MQASTNGNCLHGYLHLVRIISKLKVYVIVISLQNGVYQPYMPEAEPRACMADTHLLQGYNYYISCYHSNML